MKLHYVYKEGFKPRHYILMWLDIPISLVFIFLRLITLNLVSFFELESKWVFFKIKKNIY